MLEGVLWCASAFVIGSYVLLFALARRPVTLRLARVGGLLTVIVSLRLILIAAGAPPEGWPSWIGVILLAVIAAALVLARRVWLVRATAEELNEQIQIACRGLFLVANELGPGRLRLVAPGEPTLHIWSLGSRVQALAIDRSLETGKAALLYSWLAKQYPGPVPRLRIVLKRGDS